MRSTPEPKTSPAPSPIAPSDHVSAPTSAPVQRRPLVGEPTYRHRSRSSGASVFGVCSVGPRRGLREQSFELDDLAADEPEMDQPDQPAPLDPAAYEVGYGRPPVHTRFPKGRSGNPRGRPKGAKNLETLWSEQMNALRTVKIDGKVKRLSQMEIMVQQIVKKGMNGDLKATQWAVNAYQSSQAALSARTGSVSPGVEAALSASELASLADYQREALRNNGVPEAQIDDILRSFGILPIEVTP